MFQRQSLDGLSPIQQKFLDKFLKDMKLYL